MTPLEADIAWHRLKAEETLAAIDRLKAEPNADTHLDEIQVLTEALGRYIMTAESLEALRSPPPLKTLEWGTQRRSELQAEIEALLTTLPQPEDMDRVVRLHQELRQVEALIAQINNITADA